jgi:hypothetical protein
MLLPSRVPPGRVVEQAPGGSVSFLCLLRQVSSALSRNCRNELRRDVDEAWFVTANFMARQLHERDGYRLSMNDRFGEKNSGRVAG